MDANHRSLNVESCHSRESVAATPPSLPVQNWLPLKLEEERKCKKGSVSEPVKVLVYLPS